MRAYPQPNISVSLRGPRNSTVEPLGVLLQQALDIVNAGVFKLRPSFLVRSILRAGLEQIIRDGGYVIGAHNERQRVRGFRVTFGRN